MESDYLFCKEISMKILFEDEPNARQNNGK